MRFAGRWKHVSRTYFVNMWKNINFVTWPGIKSQLHHSSQTQPAVGKKARVWHNVLYISNPVIYIQRLFPPLQFALTCNLLQANGLRGCKWQVTNVCAVCCDHKIHRVDIANIPLKMRALRSSKNVQFPHMYANNDSIYYLFKTSAVSRCIIRCHKPYYRADASIVSWWNSIVCESTFYSGSWLLVCQYRMLMCKEWNKLTSRYFLRCKP